MVAPFTLARRAARCGLRAPCGLARPWLKAFYSAVFMVQTLAAVPAVAQHVSRTTADDPGPFEHEPTRAEVITADEIAESGASTLDEALEDLVGVSLTRASGLGVSAVVDGLPASHVTVLVDGVVVGRAPNTRSGPSFDLGALGIPLSRVRRIEIVRGIGPPGSGDAGGVFVHITTHRGARSTTGVLTLTGDLSMGNGAQPSEIAGDAAVAVPFGDDWRVEARGQAEAAAALDVTGDGTPDLTELTLGSGQALARWSPAATRFLELHVGGRRATTTRRTLTRAAVEDARADLPERLFGVFDDTTVLGVGDVGVRGRWATNAGVLRHDSALQRQRYAFSKWRVVDDERVPKHETTDWTTRHAGWLTRTTGDHRWGPEATAKVTAVQRTASDDDGASFSDTSGAAGLGFNEAWTPDDWSIDARALGELHTTYGFGGVVGGGVAWKPRDWLQLRTSASRTRRVPSSEELFFAFDHSEVGYILEGNRALRPESLWGLRAGAAVSNDRAGVEAEGYYNHLTDGIVASLDRTDGATGVYVYENAGRVLAAGVRSSAWVARLPGNLDARVRYAWLPVSVVRPGGERQPLSSEHDVHGRVGGKWWRDRLRLWTEVGARSRIAGLDGDVARPDDAARVGVGAALRFESVRVQLQVDDLPGRWAVARLTIQTQAERGDDR